MLSFVIALNDADAYEGGGTCFDEIRPLAAVEGGEDGGGRFAPTLLKLTRAGGVVSFIGKLRHGGARVTRGRRYVIPLFCYLDTNASGKRPGYLAATLPGADAVGATSRAPSQAAAVGALVADD